MQKGLLVLPYCCIPGYKSDVNDTNVPMLIQSTTCHPTDYLT